MKASPTVAAISYLYGGSILFVDLTQMTVDVVPTARYAAKYTGGRGINARILYESVDASTDPLGPDNVICFGTGPLSGTAFPGSSRTDVMCKSPVTGLIGDASMGGEWSAELKNAGWDHVVLRGKAEHPVYVSILNDRVEIRDARAIWGATTYRAEERIRADLGNPEVKIVCIGPAGENLVTFANVQSDLGHSGSRTGNGAVMGSKNVKAIAVRGTRGVKVADKDAFLEACLNAHNVVRSASGYAETHDIGVSAFNMAEVRSGGKWSDEALASAPPFDEEFDYLGFWKQYGYKRTGCVGCPVQCMEAYQVPGLGATVASCDLYAAFSAGLRIFDLKLWYKMLLKAHTQGVDSASVVTIMNWVWYLWELGMLDESITDGFRLEWGDSEAIEGIFDSIVARRGFGDVLAQGMAATAAYLDARIPLERRDGRSTYEWARQVNNNPMFGLDAKLHGSALAYSVGRRSDNISDMDIDELHMVLVPELLNMTDEERRASHEEAREAAAAIGGPESAELDGYKGKAALVHDTGMLIGVADVVGSCKWHTKFAGMDITVKEYAAALSAGLGRTVTTADLLAASLRTRNVERALECKMGRRRENDTIPAREFDQPLSRGPWKGKISVSREKLEAMKTDYYTIRGWDIATGIPYEETLLEYGLDDIAAELDAMGILPSGRPAAAAGEPPLATILADENERRYGAARE